MDTNVEEAKMSNTPRTNAATVRMERLDGDIDEVVAAFFARQLERELIAARSATAALPVEGGHITPLAMCLDAIEEASTTMRHARVMVSSREKIHPTGMVLYDECIAKLDECLRSYMKGEPAPTGCGAIFKESEGWSCDCERAHPVPCAKGEPDRPDWAQQLPGAEIFDRAARYEYLRTLNPREFAALYDEALHGDRFDDLVDRYRDARKQSQQGEKG